MTERWWKCACQCVNFMLVKLHLFAFLSLLDDSDSCQSVLMPEQRNTLCNTGGRKIKWCRSSSLVLHKLQMNITSNMNVNSVDSQKRSRICLIKGPDWLPSMFFTLIYIHVNHGFIPHQYFRLYIWASDFWWETIRTVRCPYLYDRFPLLLLLSPFLLKLF